MVGNLLLSYTPSLPLTFHLHSLSMSVCFRFFTSLSSKMHKVLKFLKICDFLPVVFWIFLSLLPSEFTCPWSQT